MCRCWGAWARYTNVCWRHRSNSCRRNRPQSKTYTHMHTRTNMYTVRIFRPTGFGPNNISVPIESTVHAFTKSHQYTINTHFYEPSLEILSLDYWLTLSRTVSSCSLVSVSGRERWSAVLPLARRSNRSRYRLLGMTERFLRLCTRSRHFTAWLARLISKHNTNMQAQSGISCSKYAIWILAPFFTKPKT